MPTEISPGQFAENVADIIGDTPSTIIAERVMPARHDHQPEFPEPGIYFGMTEDDYHSINAASASGSKHLFVSSMDHWANSNLNLAREDDDTKERLLGRAYHCRICEGAEAFNARYAPELDKTDHPDALVTTDDIRMAIKETGEKPRGSKKSLLARQLLAISDDAEIWDMLVARHLAENENKTMIPAKQWQRINIAAKMIESDPQLSKAFSGGYPEVSIFWFDRKTGCPCKARIDYLKQKVIVDLKSFSNPMGRPVQRAIDFTIANHKHYIGAVWYDEAVEAAKEMIRESDYVAQVVHYPEMSRGDAEDLENWCERFGEWREPMKFLWVYQQTGNAPVTRGRIHVRGTVWTITHGALQTMKRRYVELTKTYGVDPWLDLAPIIETADEDIPLSATDL